jgi:hypothetical protein
MENREGVARSRAGILGEQFALCRKNVAESAKVRAIDGKWRQILENFG